MAEDGWAWLDRYDDDWIQAVESAPARRVVLRWEGLDALDGKPLAGYRGTSVFDHDPPWPGAITAAEAAAAGVDEQWTDEGNLLIRIDPPSGSWSMTITANDRSAPAATED